MTPSAVRVARSATVLCLRCRGGQRRETLSRAEAGVSSDTDEAASLFGLDGVISLASGSWEVLMGQGT